LEEWNTVFEGWSFLAPNLPAEEANYLRPLSILPYYQAKQLANAEQLAKQATRVCEYFPKFNLAFLKLDSNIHSQRGPADIARGTVGLKQRNDVETVLGHFEKATQTLDNPFAEARRIVLVHHHVTRLPNVKLENWMMMDDAGEVARWLARNGARFVLHGHFHWADALGLTYWNTESQNSKVETIVVSAGSATALDVDDRHNSFHHITMGHFKTTVARPLLDYGEFQPLGTAAKFDFQHKPSLRIEDDSPAKVPIFLEALEALIVGEEKYPDQNHIYTSVTSTGFIDQDRAYFGSVELEGVNETTQETTSIPFVFSATGAQYFEECDFQATDLRTSLPLNTELSENRPIYVFPTRIFFNAPVPAGGDFKIRVHFHLKMVMLEERDYDMLSLVRFYRGVAKMELCLLSRKALIGPTLWELRGDKLRKSQLSLTKVSKTPTNPPQAQPIAGYTVTVNSPSALAYLLLYEKLS